MKYTEDLYILQATIQQEYINKDRAKECLYSYYLKILSNEYIPIATLLEQQYNVTQAKLNFIQEERHIYIEKNKVQKLDLNNHNSIAELLDIPVGEFNLPHIPVDQLNLSHIPVQQEENVQQEEQEQKTQEQHEQEQRSMQDILDMLAEEDNQKTESPQQMPPSSIDDEDYIISPCPNCKRHYKIKTSFLEQNSILVCNKCKTKFTLAYKKKKSPSTQQEKIHDIQEQEPEDATQFHHTTIQPDINQKMMTTILLDLKKIREAVDQNMPKIDTKSLSFIESITILRYALESDYISIQETHNILDMYYNNPEKNPTTLLDEQGYITKFQLKPLYEKLKKAKLNNKLPQNITSDNRQQVETYIGTTETTRLLRVTCPHCNTKFLARVHYQGGKFRCGECKKSFYLSN
ncbi:MAG: hypothetical protein KBC30_01815 [Planctomycetes bacterium]|jgi:predicted Zn finger-like uncharacterized protein|nr:hypothetical protein [Planctomycetota bacterium]HPY74346.1 hypothetical protein [Planctomycetota bacterium]HQA99888.1 hypothetical protein [Planctomycetota bacterium]